MFCLMTLQLPAYSLLPVPASWVLDGACRLAAGVRGWSLPGRLLACLHTSLLDHCC